MTTRKNTTSKKVKGTRGIVKKDPVRKLLNTERMSGKTINLPEVLIPEVIDPTDKKRGGIFQGVAWDSTSVPEISFVKNVKYSEELITAAHQTYDPKKLINLRKKRTEYLEEGQKQIVFLWHRISSLIVHTEMFTVLLLIAMGTILKEIKSSFDRPHEYARWRDKSFDERHKRFFQQAVQLANMGEFAVKYAALGKPRILQLEHIRRETGKKSCEDVIKESPVYDQISDKALPDKIVKRIDVEPFPDISYDVDNDLMKLHVDSVSTYHRLKKAGIDADFGQSKLISSYHGDALQVKEADRIKKWLDTYKEGDRKEKFDNYVMDRMKLESQSGISRGYSFSLNKLIADLLQFCREAKLDDKKWVKEQKEVIDIPSLNEVMQHLTRISGVLSGGVKTPVKTK